MVDTPEEVFPLQGTESADVLFFTQAQYLAGAFNTFWAYGFGGDDAVVRDRSGGYGHSGGVYPNAYIYGGSGFDVVSYASSSYALAVNLGQGVGRSAHPTSGYAFGRDFYDGVEGIVGSKAGDGIIGNSGANKLWGHDGNDALWGEGGNDTLYGGQGGDTVRGGSGVDQLFGESGNDLIEGGDGVDLLMGGDGNDRLEGEDRNDSLYGDGGNDTLYGGSGDDFARGDAGSDRVYGGSGRDAIAVGGSGSDTVYGGTEADTVVYANAATVLLTSGYGYRAGAADRLYEIENVTTGTGADTIFGSAGTNEIRSGGGADTVYTLGGSDLVMAGSGADVVAGYDGSERIYGEGGNDTLSGGGGSDTLRGGDNADRIRGGSGLDSLWGDAGADVFEWRAGDVGAAGADTVRDFDLLSDKLSFGTGFFFGQSAPGFDVDDVLVATQTVPAWTVLSARLADGTWRDMASFEDVSSAAIQAKIDDGSIFAVSGGGGFDDFA